MTDEQRVDVVKYRIENAENTLKEVLSHIENGFYNTAVNRMYYACYYAASALLISAQITVKSHEGVRQQLGLHFVQSGIIPSELGRFYSRLFSKRSTGDYDDFVNHTLQTVEELYPQAEHFVDVVKSHIEKWLEEYANRQEPEGYFSTRNV
ncbi:MAG: HEPN domain-containing protein [Prevotella sp.]|nr:HEPN domain-containing protein [Prevotella sp.]